MNVPKLRFNNFDGYWKQVQLLDIASFSKGSLLSKSNISDEGIECILYGELYTTYSELICTIKSKTNVNADLLKFAKENDILIPSSGESAIDIATASCVKVETVACGGDLNIITPIIDDGLFLSYQLNNSKKNSIARIAQGASVVHVYNEGLKKIKVDLPTIAEQQKIVDFLSLVDQKIELQEKKIALLKDYKKGVFKHLQKVNEKNSKEYQVKELFEITRGVVIAKTKISTEQDSTFMYPVFSSQTLNNGILGYDTSYDFDGDFLTWTTDGANAGSVFFRSGKFRCTNVCGVLVGKERGIVNQYLADVLNEITPKYVSYVGNPKLMNGVMAEVKVSIPTIEVQTEISEIITKINSKITLQSKMLTEYNKLKQALLQQMFI